MAEGDDSASKPPKGSISKSVEKKGASKEVSVSKEKSFGEKKSEGGEGKPSEGSSSGGKKPSGGKVSKSASKEFGPVFKKEAEGAVWTNQEGKDDKTFVSVLQGKASAKAIAASVDAATLSAKLTVVDAEAKGSIVHGQVDLIDKIKHLIFGTSLDPPAPPTSPMAARVGDITMHMGPLGPGTGSPNVLIGGMPAWRVGLDMHICPAPGASPHGAGPASPGASTVLINGAPAARATDFVIEPAGGPDVIAIGCPTVLIGVVTPPPKPKPGVSPTGDPWVLFESVAQGDVGVGEGSLKAEAEGSLKDLKLSGEAKAEGMVALLKGELPLKVRVRIPFTSYYVGLGVKVEGTLLSLGAGANASAKVNDGKTLFSVSAGAKAGAGIGGVGAKFGLDISKK